MGLKSCLERLFRLRRRPAQGRAVRNLSPTEAGLTEVPVWELLCQQTAIPPSVGLRRLGQMRTKWNSFRALATVLLTGMLVSIVPSGNAQDFRAKLTVTVT